MMGTGGMEILVILVIALVVFGPQKLPEMGRSLGKAIREFRSAGDDIKNELTKAANDVDVDGDEDKNIGPPEST